MKRRVLNYGFLILWLFAVCRPAYGGSYVINAFNSGELSPLIDGRTDLAKYYSGAGTVENLVVLTQGGVQKRPGTKYIATAKDSAAGLLSFEFSADDAYIIEAGTEYMRFYTDGGRIQSDGSAYEIETPYQAEHVPTIQYIQSADMMYLAHPEYAPRVLTRTADANWTIELLDFEGGPFLDENTTATTVEANAVTGSVALEASTAIFDANHVGALWRLTHTIDANQDTGSFSTGAAETSSNVTVQLGRSYAFSTHGTWTGTVFLKRSYDDGDTWKDVRPVHYEDDGNISLAGPDATENVADAIYRVSKDVDGISSGTCNWSFIAKTFDVDGIVAITDYNSTTVVTGTVESTLGGTGATVLWAEGAWSPDEGYPGTLAFYQERLVMAGTTNSPQTLWLSQTDDWPNFLAGDLDTSALSFTLASDQVNVIRWFGSQQALLIGTMGAEWKLTPAESGALSPTNPPQVAIQTSNGSANIQPVSYNNAVVYAERQARKVREMSYSFTNDSWVSPDLTALSEHITEGGITQMALQKTPEPIVWCVRADGVLLGMTYKREQEVVGWHRHELGGDVKSVAVVPGDGEDEVWIIIERTIDGETVRYVEQMQPRQWADAEDAFYVDSGLSFDGGADITITGISRADPGVVTAVDHGFSDGDQVRIWDVVGMTELNNRVFSVGTAADDTFEIRDATDAVDWDTTIATAYTSGGLVHQVENNFTTLDHLEGETVTIVGDGGLYGTETVDSNTITLDDYFNTVHAGLAFDSTLKSMRLDVPGQLLQGRTKRINEIVIRFFETRAAKFGWSATELDAVAFRDADDPLEAAPPLFSGDKREEFGAGYGSDARIWLVAEDPLPFTVTAVIAFFEVYE